MWECSLSLYQIHEKSLKEDERVLLCSLTFSAHLPSASYGNYLSKQSKQKRSSAWILPRPQAIAKNIMCV